MLVDNSQLIEYPFKGTFYQLVTDKGTGLLDQKTTEEVILDVDCDIQSANHANGAGVLTSTHAIYFSTEIIDKDKPFPIKKGMVFRGTLYGYEIEGRVLSVELSMLNACCCYIRVLDE